MAAQGDLPGVAQTLLLDGPAALDHFRLTVGRGVSPMLASSAKSVAEALAKSGPASVEWKLDGIRAQIHKQGNDIRVLTRSLDDITDRVPEVVELVSSLPDHSLIFDGELIALNDDGRPRPFQETGSRTASRVDPMVTRARTPLTAFLFDVLHLNGSDLIDEPASLRRDVLEKAVPLPHLVPRLQVENAGEPTQVEAATAFAADAVTRGHEGVVVKANNATYQMGRRGAGWIRSSPFTPSTWSSWQSNAATVVAGDGGATSIWGHGTRQDDSAPAVDSSCSARRSRDSPTRCCVGRARAAPVGDWTHRRLRPRPLPGGPGGDCLRRCADLASLSSGRGAALCPGRPAPAGQDGNGSRHDRDGGRLSSVVTALCASWRPPVVDSTGKGLHPDQPQRLGADPLSTVRSADRPGAKMRGQSIAVWGFLGPGLRRALHEHESPSASRRQLRPGRLLRQTAIRTAAFRVGSDPLPSGA